MKYNQVIKLLTHNFLQKCCELTGHNIDEIYILSIHYLTRHGGIYFNQNNPDLFYSFLFQVFLGWNKRHKECEIIIDSNSTNLLISSGMERAAFYYKDFESNKPLPTEIQALISALDYCFQMKR